jgi:type 1 glutamine amidotransferase
MTMWSSWPRSAGLICALIFALAACGESTPGSGDAGDFGLSLEPRTLELEQGGEASVAVTVSRRGGFGGAVAVSLEAAPPGVSADPLTVGAAEASGTLILRAAADAPPVTSAAVTVRGVAAGMERSAGTALNLSVVGADDGADDGGVSIVSFTASPEAVTPGESVTLSWQVEGESTVALEPARGDLAGRTSYVVWPREDTTYTLRAEAASGEPSVRELTVTVREETGSYRVLVFSKTARGFFRHRETITAGLAAIRRLGAAHGFSADHSEDADDFNSANLARYDAIIFLMTTGPVLDAAQQAALESFIQGGGGFMGVHSPSVVAYGENRPTYWPWYEGLVGAYFANEAGFQNATIVVEDREHPSTAHLPGRWQHYDEVYSFHSNPRGNVNVLLSFDVSSVRGTTMGPDHPIAWYHDYDGGRAWYTSLGHFPESWRDDEAFLEHVLGGIRYAAAR